MNLYELKPIPQDIGKMTDYVPLLTRLPTPRERERLASPAFNIDDRLGPVQIQDQAGQPVTISDRCNVHTRTPPFLSLHAKSLVVDGRIAFIGSYNVHPRSRNLDTEVGLIIYDTKVAQLLQADIERDMAPRNSYAIAARKTALPITPLGELMSRLSEASPLDIWPARYSSCFELRDGADPVPQDDPRFYSQWKDVGVFRLIKPLKMQGIKTRAAKMLGWFISPIM
jgi:phosphatidylserine/phosphatidylglycerophosphate/cardiolipin synthase-like enzyme